MKQSKLTSLVEAGINTVFGFIVSFAVWPLVAAVTGVTYSTGQHRPALGDYWYFYRSKRRPGVRRASVLCRWLPLAGAAYRRAARVPARDDR